MKLNGEQMHSPKDRESQLLHALIGMKLNTSI